MAVDTTNLPSKDAASSEDDVEVVYVRTTWWEDIRDYYFSFDRRTLGIARVFIGLFLLFDLFRRTDDWFHMYSNSGVLPTHYNLWRPQANGWTFFNAFASEPELAGLWVFAFCVYVCYLIGYKTRVCQVIAALFVASMNGRVLLIENGGYVVHNLLMLWTAFLPLGDRFSVDALLSSFDNQREKVDADLNDRTTDVARWRLKPHVTLVSLVILLQLCAIYAFNVVHKTGPAWHNGKAVHYVLYVDRMVNPLIGIARDYVPNWGIVLLTKSVMGMEAGMSLALLSPLARVWAKRIAIVFVNLLHIGFGSTFVLGPFAWALCCFSVLLFSPEDWEVAARTMKREKRRRTVRYDPASPSAFFWCRLLKRLDRFELLTFEADPRARGLEVTTPDGTKRSGLEATADIIDTLPGGPIVGVTMRIPVVKIIPAAIAALVRAIVKGFFPEERDYDPDAAPAGYGAEVKDDAGHPTIDVYFMKEWLQEYYDGRILRTGQPIAGGVMFIVGMFSALWVPPLLKRKLEISVNELLFASVTREQALYWGGLAVALFGLFLALRPFVLMNVRTPSPVRRKWIRVVSGTREMLIFAFAIGALNQALVELWVFRDYRIPQPNPVRYLTHKMRYLQGWFMFSPNPVMDDGTIVCDAVTVDGRRVDPFSTQWPPYTLREPDFDLLHAKSFAYNQIWSDYFNRMHMGGNTSFRKPMKEYMFRLPERTGNPDDAIVKGVCYWVHDMNPRFPRRGPRHIESYGYNRKELFKFSNPDPSAQKRWRELGAKEPPPAPTPVPLEELEGKPDKPVIRKAGG